jgi:hypothetical protein
MIPATFLLLIGNGTEKHEVPLPVSKTIAPSCSGALESARWFHIVAIGIALPMRIGARRLKNRQG